MLYISKKRKRKRERSLEEFIKFNETNSKLINSNKIIKENIILLKAFFIAIIIVIFLTIID
jgi:hypothetical protein